MNIEKLIHDLDDMIIDCKKTVSACLPEDGIRFFLPPPVSAPEGTVFAGSVSEWKLLTENELLLDGCTYLICRENDSRLPQPSFSCAEIKSNFLFLNAPVQTVLLKLTNILTGHPLSHSLTVTQLYRDFWRDILSFRLTEKKQIAARLNAFPFPVHAHIACILVRSAHKRQEAPYLEDVLHALQDFFPNTNICPTGNEWIILYSQKRDTSDRLDISYEAFSSLLIRHHLDAGISYVCQLPEILHTLYLTAAASMDLGRRLSINPTIKRIYTFHQYNPYYVFHLCSQTFVKQHKTENLVYLTHPDITRIYYHDLTKNNNLLDVLYTYLSCERNLNRTSEMLFMHRNTILNKLNKIESILNHKLDFESDHFLLQMSCMLLKYQHSYLRRNLNDYFSSCTLKDNSGCPH